MLLARPLGRTLLTARLALGAGVLLALASAACGDDASSSTTGGTGGGGAPPGPAIVIDLVVDASRDGKADPADPADEAGEDDAKNGAMFLPNLDDDDGDEVRDADDTIANGNGDELDRTTFVVAACTDCPDGAKAKLALDAGSAKFVRIFQLDAAGNATLVLGELGPCNANDGTCQTQGSIELATDVLRSGATFVIEGRDVIRNAETGWSGEVALTLALTDAEGAALGSAENPDGVDTAKLRVAPWQLFGNLTDFDRVWFASDSPTFVSGVKAGALEADVEPRTYSNWPDQWTQDFMQTGFFAVVRAGDTGPVVHGMRVANARPWGRNDSDSSLPIRWLNKNYLGPDRATLVVYDVPHSGDSYDSHGNHDLLPAYSKGSESYPFGRVMVGSGVLDETKAFYDAQGMQSPHYVADTSWLYVGHVDEYVSYAPAATPRGWKLLVASPRRAREMLLDLQMQGLGTTTLHEGKQWYNFDTGQLYSATITIDDLLADADIAAASQDAQGFIDQEIAKLADEVGLADDEIIELPFLMTAVKFGADVYNVAYQPGTVNALVMGDVIVHPQPFGPKVNGKDAFEADLEERLGTSANALGKDGQGLTVMFADNWEYYHALDGEVHCGTNPEGAAPFSDVRWWETGR